MVVSAGRRNVGRKEQEMSEQGFRGIPGVPDGWELVRIGRPDKGEHFLDGNNNLDQAEHNGLSSYRPIVRKIETPKQYRPFANAEEFKPHRDRWIRFSQSCVLYRITEYSDTGIVIGSEANWDYDAAFALLVFDDGTPFGVEVTE